MKDFLVFVFTLTVFMWSLYLIRAVVDLIVDTIECYKKRRLQYEAWAKYDEKKGDKI